MEHGIAETPDCGDDVSNLELMTEVFTSLKAEVCPVDECEKCSDMIRF
jgi:hypothetical protein